MTSPTDLTLATYDMSVDAYCASSPTDQSAAVAALLDAVAECVPGGRVLEIGSGPGLDALYLEQRGLTVERTDATPAFVERLRSAGHAARVLDVRDGDFGGPYDAVLAKAVLLHLDRGDMEKALCDLRAATRPGGVMAATFKEGDGEAWSHAKLDAPRWFVYWRLEPLREVLKRVGWQVIRVEQVQGRLEPWLHVLGRR